MTNMSVFYLYSYHEKEIIIHLNNSAYGDDLSIIVIINIFAILQIKIF
ncbi:hypothetical protein SAMN05444266_104358 [Chitinophaga jiangningensis]|uniref:Uncharacterized protein n=1 Tax=Chitinophaga jiangningensis TaxID=1419482 RepID=A0A1M7CJM6_9BACT|nr:hypothetical protein SAMN05444266_104358 [Chitinophaga jiangningensis]